MAHDFARKKARRGATSARKAGSNQRKSPSPWAWLSAVVLTASFVGLLVLLTRTGEDTLITEQRTETLPESKLSTSEEPRFAFYTLLPESEVLVSKTQPASADEAEVTASLPDTAQEFVLQAGSFQTESDADRRRAELVLLGFDANIKTVQMANNATWHRVQVGPFPNRSQVANARQRLASERIDSLLISQRN